jgi:hypothetical protein
VPPIDPARGDEAGRLLLGELQGGNWQAARDLLDRVDDPDDRYFYVTLCADRRGRPDWLDAWVAAEPKAVTPLLVRGAQATFWAWEARGTAPAEAVGSATFKTFWERLELAEADLREAAARDVADPTALAFLVRTCRGLELGLEELTTRFQRVVTRHPWHRGAHGQMVQGLSDNWGGSHELMLSFAREAAAGSPGGSDVPAALAEAHIERYLAIDEQHRHGRYFQDPEVLAELHDAAERSVWHPAWRPRPGWPREHNLFAFCFALGGDHVAAARHFDAVGDLVTTDPWEHFHGDLARPFVLLRDRSHQLLRR